MPNGDFYFTCHARKLRYNGDVILSFDWKSAVEHDGGVKCMIVYLARDISLFVMYCVYGESGSSLLIEPTDSIMREYIAASYGIMNKEMKSTKVQTLSGIWLKYWNIWIENTLACICIR